MRAEKTTFACSKCGHEMAATPIVKTTIVSYFAGILEVRKDGPQVGERNNLKTRVEGEAITSDEFQLLMEEKIASKEAQKKPAKKGKKQPSDENGMLQMLFNV